MKTPKLKLTSVATSATTYTFHVDGKDFGWALCTVNDATGELIITSDWGNWAHLWGTDPHTLGCCNLTYFLGCNRGNGTPRTDHGYFVDKLLGRRGSSVFSVEETTKYFHKRILERRLEDYLTKGDARSLWDDIESLGNDIGCGVDETTRTLYVERFMRIDNYERLSSEPWECTQSVESHDSKILRGTIMPALAAACYQRAQQPDYQELQAKFLVESAKRHAEYEAKKQQAASP